MDYSLPDGVWPTMITPFTEDNKIDYNTLNQLVEWYLKNKVDGLFAVCQSSEMFNLNLKERINLAKYIVKLVNGRIPVIASGHISRMITDQINELQKIAETGVEAVVLVTNRLAESGENDDVFKNNVEKIIRELSEIPLGFYECPYPYKRLLSPELLKWCAETEHFFFLKDTSCNLEEMRAKVEAVKNTGLKIYNANGATLLKSLKIGISGYSGIMANFFPDLYSSLIKNKTKNLKKAQKLQNFLGFASAIEYQYYPVNAKYFLKLEGLNINLKSRKQDSSKLSLSQKMEIEQMRNHSQLFKSFTGLHQ